METLIVAQQYGICVIDEMYWSIGYKFKSLCYHRNGPRKVHV